MERNNQDYSRSARTADQALPESSSPRFSYSISRLPNFEHRPSPLWTELLTKSLLNDMLVEHCLQLTSSNETQRPSTRGRRPTPTGPAAAQRHSNYASYPRDGVRKVQHLLTIIVPRGQPNVVIRSGTSLLFLSLLGASQSIGPLVTSKASEQFLRHQRRPNDSAALFTITIR